MSDQPTPSQEKAATTSVGELVGEVSRDLSTLMRQELELAKAELADSAKRAAAGAGLRGGAAYGAMMTVLFLSIAGEFTMDGQEQDGQFDALDDLSTERTPPGTEGRAKSLQKLGVARRRQGLSVRCVAQRLGRTVGEVRAQEDERADLRPARRPAAARPNGGFAPRPRADRARPAFQPSPGSRGNPPRRRGRRQGRARRAPRGSRARL